MEDYEIVDLTAAVEYSDLPLCPLCDQPTLEYEPVCLIRAHGIKCITHVDCMLAARAELEYSEEE